MPRIKEPSVAINFLITYKIKFNHELSLIKKLILVKEYGEISYVDSTRSREFLEVIADIEAARKDDVTILSIERTENLTNW